MKCPECGFECPAGSRFCRNCGSPLPKQVEPTNMDLGNAKPKRAPAYSPPPLENFSPSEDEDRVPLQTNEPYRDTAQRPVYQQAPVYRDAVQSPANPPAQKKSPLVPLAFVAGVLVCGIVVVLVFGGYLGGGSASSDTNATNTDQTSAVQEVSEETQKVNTDANAESEAEAQRKAGEEAQRLAEEQAEAQRKAEEERAQIDAERRAGMLRSLDGWWNAAFQGTTCAYIEGGDFYIYREDIPGGKHWRSITTAEFVRYEDGLPTGPFAGKPGYLIPKITEGDKNFYITDEDFADGRIDQIAHVESDGSGYDASQTFYRCDKPSYAY